MKIKDGYNSRETEIRISSTSHGIIELWIRESGRKDGKDETLSYLTPKELLDLFKEVRDAGKDLFK